MEIRTTGYMFAHGHRPKGRGYWGFEMNGEVVVIPGTYGDAKKEAVRIAKEKGASSITVCS